MLPADLKRLKGGVGFYKADSSLYMEYNEQQVLKSLEGGTIGTYSLLLLIKELLEV